MLKKPIISLCVFISICATVIFARFLFGNQLLLYTDIGGDLTNYYYPVFSSIINKLKSFDFSFWDPNYGLGANIISNHQIIFEPFAVIIYLIGLVVGVEKIGFAYAITAILRIMVAGIAFYSYLSCFKVSKYSRIIASLIYAFNGFIILWGQQFTFATICIIFPIILLFIEKLLNNKKYVILLVFGSAVSMIFSVYLSYMVFIAAGVYSIIRIWSKEANSSLIVNIKSLLTILASIILGIAISAPISLPVMNVMLSVSSRISNDEPLFQRIWNTFITLYPSEYYRLTASKFFSNNLSGIGFNFTDFGNYYESGMQSFCTVLFILLVPQYFYHLLKDKEKRWKYGQIIACVIMLATICLPVVSMALNGFVAPFSRHAFLLIPFYCIMIAICLDWVCIEKKLNVPLLLLTIITSVMFLLYQYNILSATVDEVVIKLTITCICSCLVGGAICLFFFSRIQYHWVLNYVLVGIIMISVVSEGFPTMNFRTMLKKDDFRFSQSSMNKDTYDAINYIASIDSSYYRIEKNYSDLTIDGDSLIQGYRGISVYNTMGNKYAHDFMRQFWPETIPSGMPNGSQHNYRLQNSNQLAETYVGLKYILAVYYGVDTKERYNTIAQFGNVLVLQNKEPTSLGIFYNNVLAESDYESLSVKGKKTVLQNAAVVEDKSVVLDSLPMLKESDFNKGTVLNNIAIYEEVTLSITAQADVSTFPSNIVIKTWGEDPYLVIPINTEELKNTVAPVYMEMNVTAPQLESMQIFYDIGKGFTEQSSMRLTLHPNQEQYVKLIIPKETQAVRIDFDNSLYSFKIDNFNITMQEGALFPNESVVEFDSPVKSNEIIGRITAENDGILVISIPYGPGWKAYVDGSQENIIRSNFGFMGLAVNSGEHDVRLVYHTPLVMEGWILFCLGIIIFFLFYARYIKQKSGKRKSIL